MSISRKYFSFGNRRDKNLSDVGNSNTALNNLLDGLSGPGTFVTEDLDAIRGLQFQDITANNLSTLSNITVRVNDPENPQLPPIAVRPLVTIKDRVEKLRRVTGEIPAFRGGQGLTARFIESTDINAGNTNSSGADIFNINSNQIIENDYWEYGYFEHGKQLDPTFTDEYGGIQWTGYFSPYAFDITPRMAYETTGLLIFEYDLFETDNWIKLVDLYDETREVTVTADSTGDVVQISNNTRARVAVNDKLSTNNDILVTAVGTSSITLSDNLTVTNGSTLTFEKTVGSDLSTGFFDFPTVEPGKLIKTRISYWFPDNNQNVDEKIILFSYFSSSVAEFPYFYSEKPGVAGPDEIRTFLSDSISPYNNNFGNTGTTGSNYEDVLINKSYVNVYTPKNSLANIATNNPVNINYTNNYNIITSVSSLPNVEVGNYIIPTSTTNDEIPKYTRVKYKPSNTLIIATENFTNTNSSEVRFIDHKGLIDWFVANSTGANVNINSNTDNLEVNNIVITNSTSSFVRITSIINSTSFSTSSNLSLSGNEIIYVYSEKGLTDRSKKVFCSGVFGLQLFSNAAAGANTLTLTSNSGVVVGQVVQYSGFIPETPSMTTVTGITGNTVNLSEDTLFEILENSTITFAPAGTTVNKEICVLPLDTSPPFLGTSDGLSTNARGLKSSNTLNEAFTVETDSLTFTTNTSNITSVTGTQQYDVKIKINSNTYFILSKLV
jgi:hypothetical protein